MAKKKAISAQRDALPTTAGTLGDGTQVELVYDDVRNETALVAFKGGEWTFHKALRDGAATLVPFSAHNNLITTGAVLLPARPVEYESDAVLVDEVQRFIRRYVDLTPVFEKLATYYVLFSWVHDAFNELPYLRFRGDFGSGKTRALLAIGSICYKAFFASGASTVSPIFHTLNAFRGTLILDEADFRFSDERAEVVKILNNGTVRGLPVLRTMMSRDREFNPQAFHVFGPKIVAARSGFDDKGLESRFLTEEMTPRAVRPDVPINLPGTMKREAQELRNKLLLFRLRNRPTIRLDESLIDRTLEPRLNQILLPLLSLVPDEALRGQLRAFAVDGHALLVAERGLLIEAQVLEVLVELFVDETRASVAVGEIAMALTERYGTEYQRPITSRWVGGVLRRRLNIRTYKSHGTYVVQQTEKPKLEALRVRYGV